MDRASVQSIMAVAVVSVDGYDAHAIVEEAAAAGRGTVVVEHGGRSVVLFSTAPRAVAFALDLQRADPTARVGLHVGEVARRTDRVGGHAVVIARELAGVADPGRARLSVVVRDLVPPPDGTRYVEVPGVGGLPRAFVLAPTVPAAGPVAGTDAPPTRLVDRTEALATDGRLLLVVAGPGTGKTTVLRAVAERHPTVWVTVPPGGLPPAALARNLVEGLRLRVPGLPPGLVELAGGLQTEDEDARSRAEALAASVAEAVAPRLPSHLLVVVDGADHVVSSTGTTLLEALARNVPPGMHVVLVGRHDPGLRTERLDLAGALARLDGAALRLHDDEVARVVARRLDAAVDDPMVANVVTTAAGHPETALLAAARVRRGIADGHGSRADLARGLVEEAGGPAIAVLETLCAVRWASIPVLAAAAEVDGDAVVDRLRADGLVRGVGASAEQLELGAAAAAVVSVSDQVARRARTAAAARFRDRRDLARALDVLRGPDTVADRLAILRADGRRLLAEGDWPAVLDALEDATDPDVALGPEGDPALAELVGEAWRLAGDPVTALRWFDRALGEAGPVSAWSAWRAGVMLHVAGELQQARALYERADLSGDAADVALVHAWHAAAAWIQGDVETCRSETELALVGAGAAEDDRALAAAWTVRAMVAATDGDRAGNDRWYLRALQHAERSGDLLQVVRIRTNRGSRLLEEGEHTAALAELEEALRTADLVGARPIHAMALSNRGQVLGRLGRLDEATADLMASRDMFDRAGSRWVGYALCHLGDLHRLRGERAQARAAYQQAYDQAAPVHDAQGTVPALTGLALLALGRDPARARSLAEQACEQHPEGLEHVAALAALAEVALSTDDAATAARTVEEGLALARQRRDRPGLARLLEVRARLVARNGDPAAAEAIVREARALWASMACPLEAARADVVLATLAPSAQGRATAERAVRTLRSHGARALADEAEAALAALRGETRAPVHVRVLGPFELEVHGAPVLRPDLPGDDARDLLAFRVVRRATGGPRGRQDTVPWPHDPDVANRTAAAEVALAAWMGAQLGEDAAAGVACDPEVVASDLDRFLQEGDRGLEALRAGDTEAAASHLLAAEATHRGGLLEDLPSAPWLAATRDEVAEVWFQVVMGLVELAERAGDDHRAVRLLLRVLERDPHDEGAHLRLVARLELSGRRGESRRRYRAYAERMQEIGVEPAPFPAFTSTAPHG